MENTLMSSGHYKEGSYICSLLPFSQYTLNVWNSGTYNAQFNEAEEWKNW